MKKVSQHIILFWSLPSMSSIKDNRLKSEILNKAIESSKDVKIITYNNETMKLRHVSIKSKRFFGKQKVRGKLSKVLININLIKSITLL